MKKQRLVVSAVVKEDMYQWLIENFVEKFGMTMSHTIRFIIRERMKEED